MIFIIDFDKPVNNYIKRKKKYFEKYYDKCIIAHADSGL